MFIKLHENIAATQQTNILSCNILSKNIHQSATCQKIQYPSPASTIKKCSDYLICLLQKVSFPKIYMYVCLCMHMHRRICYKLFSSQRLTLVMTSPAHIRCLAGSRISGIRTSQPPSSLNRASIHFKLQILTKLKCLFKHQNTVKLQMYLTCEPLIMLLFISHHKSKFSSNKELRSQD